MPTKTNARKGKNSAKARAVKGAVRKKAAAKTLTKPGPAPRKTAAVTDKIPRTDAERIAAVSDAIRDAIRDAFTPRKLAVVLTVYRPDMANAPAHLDTLLGKLDAAGVADFMAEVWGNTAVPNHATAMHFAGPVIAYAKRYGIAVSVTFTDRPICHCIGGN